jgi:hypothetical protein
MKLDKLNFNSSDKTVEQLECSVLNNSVLNYVLL